MEIARSSYDHPIKSQPTISMKISLQLYLTAALLFCLVSCDPIPKDCNTVGMHFEDVENFWKAYDDVKNVKDHYLRTKIIQKKYIDVSSDGLKLLIEKDNLTAADYATFLKDTVFYNSIRAVTLNTKNDTLQLRSHLRNFEKLYPNASFDDIYFVFGQFKRAGTVVDNTIIIQLEKNARSERTQSAFLFNDQELLNLNDSQSLVPLVMHEQVHVNQTYINTRGLLSKSICEGSADFLMHLQTGRLPSLSKETYDYGEQNEAMLWAKFITDLDIDYRYIKTDWFYNYDRDDLPPDLGYFMGYKICEKFYNEADNKFKAITFMLDGRNSARLLELSGYKGGL